MKKNVLEPLRPPIEQLPVVAKLIEGELAEAHMHYTNLVEARSNPYALHDALIERVLWASLSQLDGAFLFENTLACWNQETCLTHAQKAELAQQKAQVQQLKAVLSDILALLETLQKGTLKTVMTKSDLEWVRTFLSNRL